MTFVEHDMLEFASSFKEPAPNLSDVYFEATYKHDNFVLTPPGKGRPASKVTEPQLSLWGIDMGRKADICIEMCTKDSHLAHEYMAPFYKTNHHLMDYYKNIMNGRDDGKKQAIRGDFESLSKIQANPVLMHHGTKFHCMGHAFDVEYNYSEVEWTERLHHSIERKLPSEINVFPSYQYAQHFKIFQKTFSLTKDVFFYFRSVPDLVFMKCESTSSMYVTEDIVEIKSQDVLTTPKNSDIPNAYAQIVSGLHTMAIMTIIRQLRKDIVLKEISCKGLLVIKKTSMFLFTLKASLSEVSKAGLNVSYSEIKKCESSEDDLPLGLICAGITLLTNNDS